MLIAKRVWSEVVYEMKCAHRAHKATLNRPNPIRRWLVAAGESGKAAGIRRTDWIPERIQPDAYAKPQLCDP